MALSTQSVVSDGTLTVLDISLDYFDNSEIHVFFDDVEDALPWAWSSVAKRLTFSPAVPNGVAVLVQRRTSVAEVRHIFSDGAAFKASTLDEDFLQVLRVAQEASEAVWDGVFRKNVDMRGNRIVNLGNAINPQDAVPLAQYQADSSSAWQAKLGAEAARDSINNRLYPGVYATIPTTRPDGSARQTGDQYLRNDGASFVFVAGMWLDYRADAAASATAAQGYANAANTSASASASSANASSAAANAAGAARDAVYAINRPAHSGAEGVAYSTATTGPDSFFSIRKGGLDGAVVLSRTALCRRTGTTTYVVWGTAADGGEIDTIVNASSPSPLTGISGTANAIVANSATIRTVLTGCTVKLTPTATNTGAATLTINYAGGSGTSGTFNIIDDNGGGIGAGTLRSGHTYELMFTGSVWKIVNYGDDHERIKRGAEQPLIIDTGASTADALVVTTPYPATLSDGAPFYLVPVADNTGAVTITLNGVGPFNLRRNGGGTLQAGALKAGYKYLLNWQAAGSVFSLTVDGPILTRLLDVSTLKVLSVGGTPDTITITTEMGDGPSPGCICTFIATAANTGPVTLNLNGSGNFRIRQGSGNDLAAGDLQPGSAVQVRWSGPANSIFPGSPGNTWSLLSTGQTVGSVAEAAVDNRDPMGLLRDTMVMSPYGNVSYIGGTRVIVPRNVVVVGVGSSVGQGAGATVPADSAPSQLFINALQAALAGYGNFNFIHDNQSVGGTTANQFAGQLAASAQAYKTFVTITAGMNDSTVSAYNTGNTLPGFRNSIISLIAIIKAMGAVPILITTPHMHPTRRPALVIPTDASLIYPAFTYNVTVPYVFNATAKTIYSDTFANANYGGGALKAGDTLKVESGTNVGYYTVAAVSGDRMTITVVETLAASVTETVRIRHVNISTEDVLVPPASTSFVTRDWTGNGILLTGDVRAWHINDAMRDIATKYGALLVDAEQAFFRGVEMNGGSASGWNYMYTNPNYNHPSTAGYAIGFGTPLTALAGRVAKMLRA